MWRTSSRSGAQDRCGRLRLDLRDLTRYRTTLTDERVRHANRLHKVLEDAGIKLATVASDTSAFRRCSARCWRGRPTRRAWRSSRRDRSRARRADEGASYDTVRFGCPAAGAPVLPPGPYPNGETL